MATKTSYFHRKLYPLQPFSCGNITKEILGNFPAVFVVTKIHCFHRKFEDLQPILTRPTRYILREPEDISRWFYGDQNQLFSQEAVPSLDVLVATKHGVC